MQISQTTNSLQVSEPEWAAATAIICDIYSCKEQVLTCRIQSCLLYCHVYGVPWRIITDSGLDDLIYNTFYNKSQWIIALPQIYPLHKSLRHAPFSFLFSVVLLVLFRNLLYSYSFQIRNWLSYNSSARTPRKTLFFCCPRMRVYLPVT
jgi:hypothetical protein